MSHEQATIVLIEDEDTLRGAVEQGLQGSYAVVAFEGAESALKALRGGLTPDLLIIDVHLYGMSGLRFVNLLRQDPRLAKTRILLMSGDVNVSDISTLMQANAYLQKPCTLEQIQDAVRAALKTA